MSWWFVPTNKQLANNLGKNDLEKNLSDQNFLGIASILMQDLYCPNGIIILCYVINKKQTSTF